MSEAVPSGWHEVPVRKIASIITGPFGTLLKASEYGGPDGVPLISVGEIRDGFLRVTDETPRVEAEVTGRLPQYLLKEGDIVFGRKGGVERSARILPEHVGWFLGSDGISIRVKDGLNSIFFGHAMRSKQVQGWLLQNASGTTMPSLNQAILGSVVIRYPDDPNEQKAIAAALSDADGVVAGLERVIAKKRLIKQGAMQDLLTARRRLPGFSGEWEVKHFAQIARIRNTKVQTAGNPVAQNCIELEQVAHETGRILFWVDATNRTTVKYQFEPGDVLFGRLRPYLRKFHRANLQGVCSTEIWPLMTQGVDSGFLYQVVQSDGFIAAACEAYGTHMPRADWGKLATHEVQVPVDPNEQVAIGEVLDDMEKEIQTFESRLIKARAVKEGMMQNLLTGRVRLV